MSATSSSASTTAVVGRSMKCCSTRCQSPRIAVALRRGERADVVLLHFLACAPRARAPPACGSRPRSRRGRIRCRTARAASPSASGATPRAIKADDDDQRRARRARSRSRSDRLLMVSPPAEAAAKAARSGGCPSDLAGLTRRSAWRSPLAAHEVTKATSALCRVSTASSELRVSSLSADDRAAEVVALRFVAVAAAQERELLRGLDALGHHAQPEAAGHADHGGDDRGVAVVRGDVAARRRGRSSPR